MLSKPILHAPLRKSKERDKENTKQQELYPIKVGRLKAIYLKNKLAQTSSR